MAKIISIFNQKGGVGKTTTVVNLSAALGRKSKKVLIIDLDPQGNATSGIGVEKDRVETSIYDILINRRDLREAICGTSAENVDIVPSSVDLAGAEIELGTIENRELILKQSLENLDLEYDYIIIDCPPSLGLLSLNSLAGSDSVLIPIQCEYYALEGVSQLMNTIELVRENINRHLKIEGVVLSMFDGRTNLSIQVVEEVKKYFKGKVYTSLIPRNVRLAEAPSHGLSVLDYDIRSTGSMAYTDLAEEFLDMED